MSCAKYLLLSLMLTMLASCGREAAAPSVLQAADEPDGGAKARRQFEEGGPHLLSFTSAAKRYQEQSADLAIGVGWPGFGAGLKASVLFRYESVGILLLQKSLVDQNSRIFAGPDGSLAVRPGEAFLGRCSYETTAISQHNGGLKLASFGNELATTRGQIKTLSVAAVSRPFEIAVGDTLASLEAACEQRFNQLTRAQVERDLAAALQAQVRIVAHDQQPVDALRFILRGEPAVIVYHGQRWQLVPVTVETTAAGYTVSGSLTQSSVLATHRYGFRIELAQGAALPMTSTAIVPRTADESYRTALRLAGYVARNSAAWSYASARQLTHTVDTALLEGIGPATEPASQE